MVAKKTAVQQSASGRSTGAAAVTSKDVSGKKSTHGAKAAQVSDTARAGGEDPSQEAGPSGPKAAAKKAVAKAKKAVAKKTAVKKAAAKKAVTKVGEPEKTAATDTPASEAPPSKTATKKATPKKTATKKAAAKKAAAKKTPAKAEPPAEAPAKKSAVKKSATKKTAAHKRATKKSTSTVKETAASAAEDAAEAAETTGATTVVAKKTPGTATAAKTATALPKARGTAAVPGELAVRPGEDPWTPAEVAEARTDLQSESLRLRSEIAASEEALAGLMRDSGDGAGDDEADTGTKNITREHEMSLAANAREMLEQTERALERLDAGTYGLCENCGNPIGKARMQAFPRATLCVECKQKQERRY
ncbi:MULTISPECIES: TraR/DksA family transcriptional regulator [unclassified Streptomyces]|uniref:TraR/DksA family transcriptional regulator n=1 Tax=unclassified Streptomyces TaxID=2593676 RepID=UPI0033E43D48